MKAVVVERYGPIDDHGIRNVETPVPSAGEIRVKVQAASVGFVDGLKVRGLYQTKDPLPFTPGTEFAGIVDDVAADVTSFASGTPVMGAVRNGALAEYVVIPAADARVLPRGVTPEAGASLRVNYLTALYALDARAALRAGETLLVLGAAGGTGTAAIQVGKQLGARVIAAASTDRKREFAARCGAHATVDYSRTTWREALKDVTDGRGADVIFDPVGGAITDQAFRSIAWNGRYVIVGFASGDIPSLRLNLPLLKGGYMLGVDLAQIEQREPGLQEHLLAKLLAWLADKAFEPVIGAVFAFENFRDAFKTMQSRAALGKMVIRIGSD